ncbi:MAG: PrgI family protein [Candidatus Berkelbacteria bacterium]|nr:PrgI family protein [Candidatus Berkelbacteria bacterium]
MQFKVPQKIDIEDKIMGPLTMVQFVYAVLGAGAGYIILNSIGGFIGWILALPIFIFTFCIVFVKVNGRSFGQFLKNAIAYAANPKTRLWHKSESNVRVEIYQPKVEAITDPYANKHYSRADIEKVANVIDRRGRVAP